MKKVLIFGALGLALFLGVKAMNKPATTTTDSQGSDDIFATYDNYLLQDKDGYWMVVKNGKIYNPATDQDFFDWQTNHPGRVFPTQVPVSIWTVYSNTDQYGGTFTATT